MILELRDVCKDYTRGKNLVPVLKNVNLQVEQGDYTWTAHSIHYAEPGDTIGLYLEPDAIHIMKEFDNDDAYPDDPEEELLPPEEEEAQ